SWPTTSSRSTLGAQPMQHDELRAITLYVAASQNRQFINADMEVWWDALRDLDGPLGLEAAKALVRDTSASITPSDVRQRASQIAGARLERVTQPPPPSGLDCASYLRWHRTWRDEITRGSTPEQAEERACESAGIVALEERMFPVPPFALPEVPTE